MISLPIIFREFRTAARRPRTFIMRFGFGAFIGGVASIFLFGHILSRDTVGPELLSTLAWQIALVLFVLAPALTCGCIADEKREGTLGLLFLTHMNSGDIVLGKFVGRGFDALLLFFSAAPILFVPILIGGVGWDQALGVTLNTLALLMLTLSVGMFCSTIAASTGAAVVLTFLLLIAYAVIAGFIASFSSMGGPVTIGGLSFQFPSWMQWISPLQGLSRGSALTAGDAWITLAWCSLLGLVMLLFCVWRLPRTLHVAASPVALGWLRKLGDWAAAPTLTRQQRHRVRGRNLVLWLTFARRSRWMLLGQSVFVLGLFAWLAWTYVAWINDWVTDDHFGILYGVGLGTVFLIKALMIIHLARSFATEKEDGSLELLLSTPITNHQIIRGKILAVLGRYGLPYAEGVSLMVSGGVQLKMGAFLLYQAAASISGLVSAVALCMMISAWSKSVKQAITLGVVAAVAMGAFIGYFSMFGYGIAMVFVSMYTEMVPNAWFERETGLVLVTVAMVLLRFAIDGVILAICYKLLVSNLRRYAAR